MTFEQKLADLKKIVQQHLDGTFNNNEPVSLYEPMRYAIQAGGKFIRPVLVLLSAEAAGGSPYEALNAAAAMELVHNFTLVHDDIMDNDDLRRGRETVHKKWDCNVAILSGDGLLVQAYATIAKSNPAKLANLLSVFSNGIFEVCEGQAFDKEFEIRNDVSLDEYFNMIDKKTGKLISVSCELGALVGTDNESHITALRNYGSYLGRAFQIQDDLLDIVADENLLGKDVGSDLEENKKSFIILHAMENATGEGLEFLKKVLNEPNISQDDVSKAIQLFKDIGTVDAARDHVKSEIDKAGKELKLLPPSEERDYLNQFLVYIENRNY